MSLQIDGLDELEQTYMRALRKNKVQYRKLLKRVGKSLMANTADRAPRKSGRLRASYKMLPYKGTVEGEIRIINKDTVEAGSTVFYANIVEQGHPIVKISRSKEKGKRTRRNKTSVGYAEGQHFQKKALDDTRRQLARLAEEFFEELFR